MRLFKKKNSTIGRALGNKSSNSLSKILVPENSDNIKESYDALKNKRENISKWREITEAQEVEENKVEWCKLNFEQASETPFANKTWEAILTDENIQDEILDGKFVVPESYKEEYQEFISSMKTPPQGLKDQIGLEIKYKKFLQWATKCKESKISRPSGLHYRHYKTASTSDALTLPSFLIIKLSLKINYVLKRWQLVHPLFLEKKPMSQR